jgi:predicted alpha-1,6-mannanase (GH76 family)
VLPGARSSRSPDTPSERDRLAVSRLLRFYRPDASRWWAARGEAWQLALVIEAVATAYERSHSPGYVNALSRWFARHHNRRSRFFDDDAWYVNTWLRCYDVTGDPGFLAAARAGFADLLAGWDAECGGGLWWSHDRTYKNAITTELFLLAAARLARRCPDDSEAYLDWATRAWHWFDHSGLINVDGLVNDGLAGCVNNGGATWTYNQGVLLGGLAELWRSTGDDALLQRAHRVATAAIAHLTSAGILHELCEREGSCDQDQLIFKGVFAQGLARLHHADPAHGYADFLIANADSVWRRARDRRDRIGLSWAGPPGRITPASHAAGTLLLGQVALLETGGECWRVRPVASSRGEWIHNGRAVRVTAAEERPHALTIRYRGRTPIGYVGVDVDGAVIAHGLLFLRELTSVSVDVFLRAGEHIVTLKPQVGVVDLESVSIR